MSYHVDRSHKVPGGWDIYLADHLIGVALQLTPERPCNHWQVQGTALDGPMLTTLATDLAFPEGPVALSNGDAFRASNLFKMRLGEESIRPTGHRVTRTGRATWKVWGPDGSLQWGLGPCDTLIALYPAEVTA